MYVAGVALALLAAVAEPAGEAPRAQPEGQGKGQAQAEPVRPPGPIITVVPARTQFVFGTAADIDVDIQISGPEAGSFTPARTFVTVGALDMPKPNGPPGRFSARYVPPADRFPEVALLVVEFENGPRRAFASARIALEGSTTVPFHTSPGAAVTMRVADQIFGPVAADHQGHVNIPIEVPPGVRTGVARAVDHNAAVRETEVDLQLPPFPRVVLLAPVSLEVGSFAEIAVMAVEPDGAPTNATKLTLGASDGMIHPLGAGPAGEARFLFEAPRRLGGGAVALTATVAGAPPGRADLAVPLHPGAATQLSVSVSVHRLVVAVAESAEVVIAVHDAFGNPTSAVGVQARVDGVLHPVAPGPVGIARLSVPAPPAFTGRDRIEIAASLGAIQATEEIHLTGGTPTRLTIDVRQRRVVADGQRSAEVRVQAVDSNGTPTLVPGLSWETPEGRVRHVRVPRDGEYVAEYVPDRTREPRRDTVTVMASHDLRADANVEATPPPVRFVAAARAGLYTNFGRAAGTAVFLEALRPAELWGVPFQAGLTAGYLHGQLDASGLGPASAAAIAIDQLPLLAIARTRIALPFHFEVVADVGAGVCWADTRIAVSPASSSIAGTATAYALGAGSEIGLPLKPGRLVIGLRYLWIDLGKTSHGDRIEGNSAGLIGDIGYKMAF